MDQAAQENGSVLPPTKGGIGSETIKSNRSKILTELLTPLMQTYHLPAFFQHQNTCNKTIISEGQLALEGAGRPFCTTIRSSSQVLDHLLTLIDLQGYLTCKKRTTLGSYRTPMPRVLGGGILGGSALSDGPGSPVFERENVYRRIEARSGS